MACKNLNEARNFLREVGELAKKYRANFFIVTDGASMINNNGNKAVEHARKCQVEWEKEHGFDPNEDWGKSGECLKISLEDGTTITIEDKKEKKEIKISLDKLKKLVDLFSDNCSYKPYSDEDISSLESELNFELGNNTKEMIRSIGNLKVPGFEVPNKDGLIKLTNKWKESVATEDQKDKYIVIEADGPDYTLIDKNDMIFVYDGKEKKTESYDEDVLTHIGKHFMSKLVGDEYEY